VFTAGPVSGPVGPSGRGSVVLSRGAGAS